MPEALRYIRLLQGPQSSGGSNQLSPLSVSGTCWHLPQLRAMAKTSLISRTRAPTGRFLDLKKHRFAAGVAVLTMVLPLGLCKMQVFCRLPSRGAQILSVLLGRVVVLQFQP